MVQIFSLCNYLFKRMKISQSLLFAYAAAQGEDRWSSTDYYSFNYGFGNDGRQDAGLAFGLSENPTPGAQSGTSYANVNSLYMHNNESAHYKDQLHFNGLLCWMCDFRLDLATEAETEACADVTCQNAYARCLKGGMLMRCRGEQRTCMFEERRRHGVVYSVCTGCKQTDACVAHWRRNQRFTLPFMNFGDMSLRNLPQRSGNLPFGAAIGTEGTDQLPNHRPVYVDDECSTYQETRSTAAWRRTVNDPSALTATSVGTNNEVYPMGWIPAQIGTNVATAVNPYTGVAQDTVAVNLGGDLDFNPQNSRSSSIGLAFSSNGSDLKFTGHRVNVGLSYSKFAYDGSGDLQLNAQLSQWESTCRWCCHARPDTVCNIEMKTINSSPFATKCGNNMGTRRDIDVVTHPYNDKSGSQFTYEKHPLYDVLANLKKFIDDASNQNYESVNSQDQRKYWGLLDSLTASVRGVTLTNTQSGTGPETRKHWACSLSNAQWDILQGTASANLSDMQRMNRVKVPQGINGKFRFFQPFNIAQATSDYYNGEQKTCGSSAGQAYYGDYCSDQASDCNSVAGACSVTGAYETGPRFWMQMFQRTPQYDLSHWYSNTSSFTAKFPATGEGRNSAGMDKFAGRGNKSRWTLDEATLRENSELQHFFQQQTDMISQENRDFFDSRARDAATSQDLNNLYLKRWDNSFWTNK